MLLSRNENLSNTTCLRNYQVTHWDPVWLELFVGCDLYVEYSTNKMIGVVKCSDRMVASWMMAKHMSYTVCFKLKAV